MTEEKKPKILLVWGVHPNESAVTEYLANALKPLLEQRGFDVEIFPMPHELTIHHSAENGKLQELYMLQRALILLEQKQKNANFVFELHTTPDAKFEHNSGMPIRKPKFFQARYERTEGEFDTLYHEIPIITTTEPQENYFQLECVAKYKPANKKWWDLYDQITKSIPDNEDLKRRLLFDANLKETQNANFLSSRVIAKIIHLIDTQLKRKLDKYKIPKPYSEFKPKTDKDTAKKLELRRRILRMRERMRPR